MMAIRRIICVLLVAAPLLLNAQRAAFGPFVIDSSTIADLGSIANEARSVFLPYHDTAELDYSGRSSHFYVINEEQDLKRLPGPDPLFKFEPGNQIFYLDNIHMGEMLVTSMWLGYRNGVLQLLQCDAKMQLTLYMHSYFGKGVTSERTSALRCKTAQAGEITRTVPQYVTEWILRNSVRASYTISSYFDERCMLQRYAVMRIENKIE